jgi:hypothetical protein
MFESVIFMKENQIGIMINCETKIYCIEICIVPARHSFTFQYRLPEQNNSNKTCHTLHDLI